MEFTVPGWSAKQAMKFDLVDMVLERQPDRIRTLKQVSLAEEYLQDHFPTFPVLPGVLMVEALVQSARTLLARHGNARLVLGEIKALKFGAMVKPGDGLELEVELLKMDEDGSFVCKGTGTVRKLGNLDPELPTAVSGRFVMRPIRVPA